MKFIVLAVAMFLSAQSFAQTTMGPEAVEMFNVINHTQVQDCLRNVNLHMVNTEITKTTARCPMCNTYVISGYKLNIDMPARTKTVIKIVGKGVRSTFGYAQTYSCTVKEN